MLTTKILIIILLLISVIFNINCSYQILKEKYKYTELQKIVSKKYIKKDIVLQNAVFEALVQATENHNKFEQKAYEKLLNEIKEKDKNTKDIIN